MASTPVGFVQAAMALHSLVMAATYLAAGKLALKLGEKRIFVIGALILAIGVIVAALGPTIWVVAGLVRDQANRRCHDDPGGQLADGAQLRRQAAHRRLRHLFGLRRRRRGAMAVLDRVVVDV
jgi:hypothetical protein